jgi:hypothetical protein
MMKRQRREEDDDEESETRLIIPRQVRVMIKTVSAVGNGNEYTGGCTFCKLLAPFV